MTERDEILDIKTPDLQGVGTSEKGEVLDNTTPDTGRVPDPGHISTAFLSELVCWGIISVPLICSGLGLTESIGISHWVGEVLLVVLLFVVLPYRGRTRYKRENFVWVRRARMLIIAAFFVALLIKVLIENGMF